LGGTLLGCAAATLVFSACFSARPTHEWSFFPTLLSRVRGFEQHTKQKKTDDYLWAGIRAKVELPLLLTGNARYAIALSSPAGSRRVTLASNDAHSLPAIVDGIDPMVIDFGLNEGRWRHVHVSIDATRLSPRTRGVRAHTFRLRRDSGWLLPDIRVAMTYLTTLLLLLLVLGRLGFPMHLAASWILLSFCAPTWILAAIDPLAAAHLCLRLFVWIPLVLFVGIRAFVLFYRRLFSDALRPDVVRLAAMIFMATLMLRGGWLLHPRHYHKDELIHAQMPRIAMENGVIDLWRNIEAYQAKHLLGETNIRDGLVVMKYPPTFYTLTLIPNVVQRTLGLGNDILYWNKLLAVIMSAAQILPILAVACRFGPLPIVVLFCGLLEAFSPVEIHELSCVALSATTGKLADLTLLAYLILKGPRMRWATTSVLMLICLMSYVTSVVNLALICGLYVVTAVFDRRSRAVIARLMLAGALAIVAASLVFYGDLWLRALIVHLPAGYRIESFGDRWAALGDPARWFWGEISLSYTPVHIAVWICGLILTRRSPLKGVERGWWLAWNIAVVAAPALQCLGGRVLEYYKSAYLTAPVISICGGIVLSRIWRPGRSARGLTVCVLSILLLLQLARIIRMIPPFFVHHDAMILPAWPF
jgi:hypothetical protein